MPNIASIISSHNKTILTKHTNTEPTVCDTCNCRQKMSCPLDGKCLAEGVVYQATVKREDTGDFRNPKRKYSIALSKYIWNLKDINANFSLKWKIIKRCKTYSGRTKIYVCMRNSSLSAILKWLHWTLGENFFHRVGTERNTYLAHIDHNNFSYDITSLYCI